MFWKRHRAAAFMAVLIMVSLLITACGSSSNAPSPGTTSPGTGSAPKDDQPKKGGVLRVALDSEPPSLDIHTSTATVVYMIGWHMAEQLFTFDESYNVIPMLVETHTSSADSLHWTFNLRQGVPFHNSKEMTSEDVLASMERWGRMAGAGQALFKNIESLTAPSKYSIEMKLKSPMGGLMMALASPGQGLFIYPKEEMEKAKDAAGKDIPMDTIIGTGPYKLVEWAKDRHIQLDRFEQYAQRNEPGPLGFGGRKEAYFDQILVMSVPDAQTRLAGLQAGDYDTATAVSQIHFDDAKRAGLTTNIIKPSSWLSMIFNKQKGPFTDVKLRQAFLASLSMDDILEAGVGDKNFYRLDPSIVTKEIAALHTTAGAEAYNKRDVEKAKRLMAEAGYNGEPIRWIFDQTSDYYRKSVLVATDQLKNAGWNIELVGMDWPTMITNRSNPDAYEIFTTGFTPRYDATQTVFLSATWPGWYVSERKDDVIRRLNLETDPAKQKVLVDELNTIFYEEVPVIKVGDVFTLRAGRSNIVNQPWQLEWHYWNTWRK
jgi:peptide/nickel transport system substrate-binding protein